MLVDLSPCIAALTVVALVNAVSTFYQGYQKVVFSTSTFALAFALCVAFTISEQEKLDAFWATFKGLDVITQFVLSMLVITTAYFGGMMQIANASSGAASGATPASCDQCMDFDVPKDLPEKDNVFFEECLGRFSDELIADMPTVYEMPDEAVQWVERMVQYTVSLIFFLSLTNSDAPTFHHR